METLSRFVRSSSNREECLSKKCCMSQFQPLVSNLPLKSKGAALVLMWSTFCFSVFNYFNMSDSRDPIKRKFDIESSEFLAMGLLLPVGGWLADAYLGRYRTVCYGMWTMWLGTMLNGLSLVIGKLVESYSHYGDPWVSFVCRVIMGAGFAAFQANIIPLGIDQLIDSSSSEIKSFIKWYTMLLFGSTAIVFFISLCSPEYMSVLVIAVCTTLALLSNILFNHWLMKEQIISNPLPLILKVVYFTFKNNLNKQRTFHLEQQGLLSKFNIAKSVYRGPFTSEQVEDVKTFFRVIAVTLIFSISCSGLGNIGNVILIMAKYLHNWPNDSDNHSFRRCYQGQNISNVKYVFTVVAILVYQIVFFPAFHRCIPSIKVSITTKLFCSVILLFASVVTLLGIESASYVLNRQAHVNQTVIKCVFQNKLSITSGIDYYWLAIPLAIIGFSIFLFISSSIEFICAQAPFNMKGLIIGIGCACFGFTSLIQTELSYLFTKYRLSWDEVPLSCGIWYFVMQALIVSVGFLVALVIVKVYKKRTRISASSQSDWQECDYLED